MDPLKGILVGWCFKHNNAPQTTMICGALFIWIGIYDQIVQAGCVYTACSKTAAAT